MRFLCICKPAKAEASPTIPETEIRRLYEQPAK
jgi:hypothetical protein